jgi:hypothetical protein
MGSLGGALGQVGQAAQQAAAATPIGQFVSNVGSQGVGPALGQATGLTNLVQGLTGLFGGGDGQAAAPSYTYTSPYAVPFQAAEGPIPGDLSLFLPPEAPPPVAGPGDFVGPPSPFKPPNFFEGLVRGLTGRDVGGGADVLPPGAQVGGGVGELLAFLDKIRQQSSGQMGGAPAPLPPVVQMGAGGPLRPTQLLPGYQQAQAPAGGLVHNLIGAFTYGILGGGIPSSGQV